MPNERAHLVHVAFLRNRDMLSICSFANVVVGRTGALGNEIGPAGQPGAAGVERDLATENSRLQY